MKLGQGGQSAQDLAHEFSVNITDASGYLVLICPTSLSPPDWLEPSRGVMLMHPKVYGGVGEPKSLSPSPSTVLRWEPLSHLASEKGKVAEMLKI